MILASTLSTISLIKRESNTIFNKNKFYKKTLLSFSKKYIMLLIVCACCCVLFLLRLMWSRRRFYYLSSKLNGPISWPLIGNSLSFLDSSTAVNKALQISRSHGSPLRFWLGGNFIVHFDTPEEIEVVLTSPESIDKGDIYNHVKRMLGGDGLFTMGGEGWKFHRKSLSPPIQNFNILNSFYPSLNKNVKVMIELLENKVGKGSFDIYHYLEACTLDMICENTFGITMNVQRGENLSFLDCINTLIFIIGILIFQPWYRFYPIFRLSKYYELSERCKSEARLYVKNVLDKRIEELKSRTHNGAISNESNELDEFGKRQVNIFIDELLKLSMVRKCFSEEDMITEALTVMSGGFETTALTVSYIVLMLALHPEYQEKVFQELRDIFPEQRSDVTAEDIAKFQYTEQFIKESMRYTPTVPLLTRYAKKDLQIGKHTIPKGTELIMSIISLHRNPNVWGEKADVFDPDHFLPEACRKRHPYSFIPFSAGIRNCIGLKYGNINVRIFVAWLVRNYRFTTDLKLDELRFKFHVTMKLAQNHMVHVHKRENY